MSIRFINCYILSVLNLTNTNVVSQFQPIRYLNSKIRIATRYNTKIYHDVTPPTITACIPNNIILESPKMVVEESMGNP